MAPCLWNCLKSKYLRVKIKMSLFTLKFSTVLVFLSCFTCTVCDQVMKNTNAHQFLSCLLSVIAPLSAPLLGSEKESGPWRWWKTVFSYSEGKKSCQAQMSIKCNFLKYYTFVWKERWQIKGKWKMLLALFMQSNRTFKYPLLHNVSPD